MEHYKISKLLIDSSVSKFLIIDQIKRIEEDGLK